MCSTALFLCWFNKSKSVPLIHFHQHVLGDWLPVCLALCVTANTI
jgi:hypothetical protein